MNELVNLIVKKTKIPSVTAQIIVRIVVDYIKKKLPAPVGKQIDAILSNDAAVKKAADVIGGLVAKKKKK
jgi:hypothetical protein